MRDIGYFASMLNYRFSMWHSTYRTVARKSSIGGLCVCAKGLDIEKLIKTPLMYSVSCFSLGGSVLCLGVLSPPKPPRGDGNFGMVFVFVSNKYACCAMRVYSTSLAIACLNVVQVMFAIASNE